MRFLLEANADLNGFLYNLYDEQSDSLFQLHYPMIDWDKEYIIESTGEVLKYINKPTPWDIEIRFNYEALINHRCYNVFDFYEALQCLIENNSLWIIPETCFEYDEIEKIAIKEFAYANLIDRIISIHPE